MPKYYQDSSGKVTIDIKHITSIYGNKPASKSRNKYYQASLRNIIYRLRKFEDYLGDYLDDYFRLPSTKELIKNIVMNRQLYKQGIEGHGIKIWDYAPYSRKTIKHKRSVGQPATRVTLKDKGNFYRGFTVVPTHEGVYITSTDEKTEALTKKYGDAIFRITNENFNKFVMARLRKDLVSFIKLKYGIETR